MVEPTGNEKIEKDENEEQVKRMPEESDEGQSQGGKKASEEEQEQLDKKST